MASRLEINLRILILVDCYYPSIKSGAKLVHDLAVELSCRGHHTVVLTPCNTIPQRFQICTEDGITVARVKTARIKGTNKIHRALSEGQLSSRLWRAAESFLRQNPCDLILFYSPTIFFGDIVRKLKKLWQCPAYLILRDIFPDWAVDAGILRRGLIYRFFRRIAVEQYRIADVIGVQSPMNLAHFARSFPREQFELRVLLNWTDLKSELVHTNHRERLDLSGKIVFLYGGNIGVAQDMDNILRLAARLLTRRDIHILLVGEGSEMSRLMKTIERDRLTNVQIVPGLSQADYLSLVSEFDVGLISLDARLKTQNIPGKLLSYLHWGLPVLASINPGNDLFDLLHESHAGLCVPNGDDEQLYRAALQLADDKDLRNSMKINARRLLEQRFSVASAVDLIFEHLSQARVLSSSSKCVSQLHSSELAEKALFSSPKSGTRLLQPNEPMRRVL
jgi:glycosyltransferase involved in cell wall biosynthesis